MTEDPKEALASIQAARAEVGRTLDYPAGWDLFYAAILALMVGGAGLPQPWSALTLLASLGGLVLMVRWWRRRFGWWVSGFGPRSTRWVAALLAAALVGLMALSFWTRFWGGPWWAPVLAAVLAALVGVAAGRLWMRAFRKELEGSPR